MNADKNPDFIRVHPWLLPRTNSECTSDVTPFAHQASSLPREAIASRLPAPRHSGFPIVSARVSRIVGNYHVTSC